MDAARPKTRWTRIGILQHETSEFRPLVGFKASGDGGLMLTPGDYIPAKGWAYGIADLPGGKYIGRLPGRVRRDTVVTCQSSPKMHSHRSGWLSIDLTGRLPRRSIRCLPIPRVRGGQVFTYSVTSPEKTVISPVRVGDAYVVSHGGWPESVSVYGFLYSYDRIAGLRAQLSSDTAATHVQHRQAELVIDLAGHGLEMVLVLRFDLGCIPHNERSELNAWLFGFDTFAVLDDSLGKAIGLWTVGDYPKTIALCPPTQRPFQGFAPFVAGTPDITKVHRKIGNGVISIESDLRR